MKSIQKLPENLINKIAAGEVVERPTSVVKELVENSIDSGASIIKIDIVGSGKELIQITDNGSGISAEDIGLLFERHATSKIKQENDIYNIATMGFRGEALSSISAVSSLELITKSESDLTGSLITASGGKILNIKNAPSNQGTVIKVRNLFFNTPARKKFMKSNQVEQSAVNKLVNQFILANPSVKFVYSVDKKPVVTSNGDGNMLNAIVAVFGSSIAKNLIKFQYEGDNISLYGYVSDMNLYRNNKKEQYVFINNRIVEFDILSEAINEEYRSIIPLSKFPVFFLNAAIDYSRVDVNIHPNKLKVKVDQEELLIADLAGKFRKNIYSQSAVKTYEVKKDLYKEKNIVREELDSDIISDKSEYKMPFIEKMKPDIQNNTQIAFDSNEEIKLDELIDVVPEKQEISTENISTTKIHDLFEDLYYLGQVFNSYLLFSKGNSMIIIDQHAAHEKINYEEFMDAYKNSDMHSQMLLVGQTLSTNAPLSDDNYIDDLFSILAKSGFDVEIFGTREVIIRAIPVMFSISEATAFVHDFLENTSHLSISLLNAMEEKIISNSCKKAVKAHDKLETMESKEIIKKLKTLKDPYTCPHGRPVAFEIHKNEFDKYFNRT